MKRVCVIVFFIFLGTQLIPAQTITVNSPAAGVTWYKGETKTISWTKSGCADPDIKINIFRNSIDPANFVEQLTCTGCSSQSWTIPGSYANGNYQIRVKTEDNVCVGDSGVFYIDDPSKKVEKVKDSGIKKVSKLNPGIINLSKKKPDLSINVEHNIHVANIQSYLNILIMNKGEADSPGVAVAKLRLFYLGLDGQAQPTSQTLINTFSPVIPAIKVNDHYIHTIKYTFTIPGKYMYSAEVNLGVQQQFTESDYTNNSIPSFKAFWVYK